MKVVATVLKSSCSAACAVACLAVSAIVAQGQNVIPVFSAVNVRLSVPGASVTDLDTFGTAALTLNCPTTGSITGFLSGPLPAASSTPTNLLVDNYISLTKSSKTTNLCNVPGYSGSNPPSCFRPAYGDDPIVGADPDFGNNGNGPLGVVGGVTPIDVHSFLSAGANQITFNEVDFGGYFAASTINLITNCTSGGASGGGKITGNQITTTNTKSLTQPFTFSGATGVVVGLVYDASTAQQQGTLTIPAGGSTPTVTDQAIDPSTFPSLVKGTSFATSQCLLHLGEHLTGSTEPACKLFTVTCTIGNGTDASGINCPKTTERNVVLEDLFDFPALSLPDIIYTEGNFSETFHQGFGFIQASEDWNGVGGPCTFEAGSDQLYSCPENILTEFVGPGKGTSRGTSQPALNSEFISVGPVPEYATHVDLTPYSSNRMWVNSHDVTATFNTRSPILPADFNGGDLNGFVAAAPYSITYGVAPLAGYPSIPSTEFPVPGDKTIKYPGGCPAPGTPAPAIWNAGSVPLHVDSDGQYLVHYFATDCAGTQELYFRQDNTGSWYTTFYTAIMFVDTVKPKVISNPKFTCFGGGMACIAGTLDSGGPIFYKNSKVQVTYQCSDDFSGVATCGNGKFSNPVPNPPAGTYGVDVSKVGIFPCAVHVIDEAGNVGTEVKVYYGVI